MKTNLSRAAVTLSFALLGSPLAAQTFTKYVALGDSITAAVQGACLVERHQARSYSRVIATQLGFADFQQPLVGEATLTGNLAIPKCLGAVVAGNTITVGPVSDNGNPKNTTLPRPYDNLGMNGANTADLVDLKRANPMGGTANQAALLVLRNFLGGPFQDKSAVDEANILNPNLVTLWIGNNDVLGALTTAVAVDQVTLTSVAAFEAKYTQVLAGLRASNRTLVVANIPDVSAIPFGTTVPPFVVDPQTRRPVLVGGQRIPLLGSRPGFMCPSPPCQVPPETLVTILALPMLAEGVGIPCAVAPLPRCNQPLPDGSFTPPSTLTPGVLLYPDEVALIRQRTNELNAKISSIASANSAILLDVNAIFDKIKTDGYSIGGIKLTKDLLTGGLFSADGVHPSNIAHMIVADEIIKVLNSAKGAAIERPNLAAVLFAEDVPLRGSSSSAEASIVLEDAPAAWTNLLQIFPPVDAAVEVVFPTEVPERAPVVPVRRGSRS